MRPDILDTEPNPDKAEKKLHIAIDRVKGSDAHPARQAVDDRDLQGARARVSIAEPVHERGRSLRDDAPALADGSDGAGYAERDRDHVRPAQHDEASRDARARRDRAEGARGADEARELHRQHAMGRREQGQPGGDSERRAPRPRRSSSSGRAAHQQRASAAVVAGAARRATSARQIELLSRAATEYKLAATGWQGYLKQDENAPDAYESRYWNADARDHYVRIQVTLHNAAPKLYPEPSKKDIDEALAAAVDVRDSNEDDKYLDNAALFVVDVSDVDRDLAYARFKETGGTSGIEQREEVKFDGTDPATRNGRSRSDARRSFCRASTRATSTSTSCRRTSTRRSTASSTSTSSRIRISSTANSTSRSSASTPMWQDHCAKDEYGYKAWEKLITMSNLERATPIEVDPRSPRREKAHSCAVTAEQASGGGQDRRARSRKKPRTSRRVRSSKRRARRQGRPAVQEPRRAGEDAGRGRRLASSTRRRSAQRPRAATHRKAR